jgi:hypothetical protein
MHFALYLGQSSCRIAAIRQSPRNPIQSNPYSKHETGQYFWEQHLQLILQPWKTNPSLQHRRRTRDRHRPQIAKTSLRVLFFNIRDDTDMKYCENPKGSVCYTVSLLMGLKRRKFRRSWNLLLPVLRRRRHH